MGVHALWPQSCCDASKLVSRKAPTLTAAIGDLRGKTKPGKRFCCLWLQMLSLLWRPEKEDRQHLARASAVYGFKR